MHSLTVSYGGEMIAVGITQIQTLPSKLLLVTWATAAQPHVIFVKGFQQKKKSSKPTVTLTRPRWRCSEAVPWCAHRTVRVFPGSVQKLHLQFYYNRQDCRVEKHAHTRTLARTVTRALKAAAVLPQGHCMWDCNALFPPHTLSPLHTHTSSITSWDFFHHTVQVFGRRYRTCHIMTQT